VAKAPEGIHQLRPIRQGWEAPWLLSAQQPWIMLLKGGAGGNLRQELPLPGRDLLVDDELFLRRRRQQRGQREGGSEEM